MSQHPGTADRQCAFWRASAVTHDGFVESTPHSRRYPLAMTSFDSKSVIFHKESCKTKGLQCLRTETLAAMRGEVVRYASHQRWRGRGWVCGRCQKMSACEWNGIQLPVKKGVANESGGQGGLMA